MLEFVQSQILFYFAIILVLFLPGWFLLLAFFGKEKLSALERFVISVGLSILVSSFLMMLMSKIGIVFSRFFLVAILAVFAAGCFAVYKIRQKKLSVESEKKIFFDFSQNQLFFIIAILFLSIFIRAAYLQSAIPPSSTDLGHHAYWSKLFAETGKIHDYVQSDIIEKNGIYEIGAPHSISDFIIGEHLFFSAIALISGASFISAFPIIVLFLINIFSLLALFILSLRLFSNNLQNKNIAIFALFFSGALFAIDPPQAKFVGGGVIGNIIGNLLVPLTFYFYIRFLREKETNFLFFALFFSMGLFYTHHLSALIFLLVFSGFILLSLIFNFKETKNIIFSEKKASYSLILVSFFLFAIAFIFFVYTPTYLKNSAISTVVGTIKKADHIGLSLLQFRNILGETRIALGILGVLLLLLFYKKSEFKYSALLIISWAIIISLISLAPDLIKIDIPSGRVANYGIYPFALLGAFAFVSIFAKKSKKIRLLSFSRKLIVSAFLALFVFIFTNGLGGNENYLKTNNNAQKTLQTFNASEYLAEKINKKDFLISDHIYVFADSWIKLFFMRGYNFPVYRANLDRYENGIDKNEFCSRDMISNPGGELGKKCFADLNIDFAMINKETDSSQFKKLNNFWQVYSNDKINVYYRKK
ncbi:MAG TPA: hypothetical protein DCS28_02605 [Candidatus Moranbacteria bacterium]|nr:hypothetical protein [Candidatus Moranbacteria bacterium]HAT74906.1 hypothetical protein [Candidatus Moranbacteria bacterium]